MEWKQQQPGTLKVAIYLDGGFGDFLLASSFLHELFILSEHSAFDFFVDPKKHNAFNFVYQHAPFLGQLLPAIMMHEAQIHYDVAIKILSGVRYYILQPQAVKENAPHFLEAMDESFRRMATVLRNMDIAPHSDHQLAELMVKLGYKRPQFGAFSGGTRLDRFVPVLIPDITKLDVFERFGLTPGQYITVHDGWDVNFEVDKGNRATKTWPERHWQVFLENFRKQYPDLPIVQIGSGNSADLKADISLVKKTTMDEATWILKNSALHVDNESGLVHLAHFLRTPTICLIGPTNADYFGYPDNHNIVAKNCTNCWWLKTTWLSQCVRELAEPECMASLLPEYVMNAANEILAARITKAKASYELVDIQLYTQDGQAQTRPIFNEICQTLGLPALPISQHINDPVSEVYIHASKQWEYAYAWEQRGQAKSQTSSKPRWLDLGGGRGALSAFAAAKGYDTTVYDINYAWDDRGLDDVERKFFKYSASMGFNAEYGSSFCIPEDSETYDVISCISVIEHVPYKEYVLREAQRLLKPGGILILTYDFSEELKSHSVRTEIFSNELMQHDLAACGISFTPFGQEAIIQSILDIQMDEVCGIPQGMTVGGMVIRKSL